MECSEAIVILAVIAVLASITTIALTTTSILLLWKPQLIDKFKTVIKSVKNFKRAQSTPGHPSSPSHLTIINNSTTTTTTTTCSNSTLHLTTIHEVEEPSAQAPTHTIDDKLPTETELENDGENICEKKSIEFVRVKGDERESNPGNDNAPTSPRTSDTVTPNDTHVRKRSRVNLTSLASTISLKLVPRRVSSGGHTVEEVTDLVRDRSTSPSSEEDELGRKDAIFTPESKEHTTKDSFFVLDLQYDLGESVV